MNYTEFYASLKNDKISPVYLFHGEEEYVKEEAYKALIKKVLPQFEELNLNIFDSASANEITAAIGVMPFMADKRVVLCRFMPKEKDAKVLCDYISNIPQDSMLIFYLRGKADGKSALVKKLKSAGAEVLFEYLSENDAAKWVVKHALEKGCTISIADALFMVTLVGKDMLSVKNELSKLCDYVGEGGVITREIIPEIVIKNLEYQLYNTYSYFINGKFKDGFKSLDAITDGKDKDSEAMGISGYFLSCLKATLTAYNLLAKKAPQHELETQTGKKGYALKDLCANAKRFNRQQLLHAIELFSGVSQAKIMFGKSSYNTLVDAIISTFSHIKG